MDNQSDVEIHILQGERPLARDNKSLGKFHLTGIPPAPARVPQIEVTFDIDANGILNVSAKDLGTGNHQKITITGSGNLNREEIDRMVKEAEMNAESDREAADRAELKNKADQLAYSVEKTLKEAGIRSRRRIDRASKRRSPTYARPSAKTRRPRSRQRTATLSPRATRSPSRCTSRLPPSRLLKRSRPLRESVRKPVAREATT